MRVNFAEEPITKICKEVDTLIRMHYDEVATHKDIPLLPRWKMYFQLSKKDALACYTVRGETGELLGYAAYFVDYHMHYKTSKTAIQDVFFLHPSIRGRHAGSLFIKWCDEQLRARNVQLVICHVKTKPELDFGVLYERGGYDFVDKIYAKRLDKE